MTYVMCTHLQVQLAKSYYTTVHYTWHDTSESVNNYDDNIRTYKPVIPIRVYNVINASGNKIEIPL